ncbi:MAG: hypothetical protein ACE5FU_02705 [Nitrospinota bacterium]
MNNNISSRKIWEGALTAVLWGASFYIFFVLTERFFTVFHFARHAFSLDILFIYLIGYVSVFFHILLGVLLWSFSNKFIGRMKESGLMEDPSKNGNPAPLYDLKLSDLQTLKHTKNITVFLDKESSRISIS